MTQYYWEKHAEYLLSHTKEWEENTQLENMTWLSRKIINYLDEFDRPHQDSPNASSLMEYIKEKVWITDESIIINSIKNILQFRNNDVTIWKSWKERKTLVNLKIYNYCTTLLKWYENILETVEDSQEEITDILEPDQEEDPNQMKIEFPSDPE